VTLTREAYKPTFFVKRPNGTPPLGPGDFSAWEAAFVFEDEAVLVERLAPDVSRLKLRLDLANGATTPKWPWQWRDLVDIEWRVALAGALPDEDRRFWFQGFLLDPEIAWDVRGRAWLTAVGNAWRLLKDCEYIVYGRYMTDYNFASVHATALPCRFNADGRPNKAPDPGPDGYPVFTFDDDPDPEWWTLKDILDYLQGYYNSGESWLKNFNTSGLATRDIPVVADVEGQSLWQALATACGRDGYDVYESVSNGANGYPESRIRVVQQGAGTARTHIKRQASPAPGSSGAMPAVDLKETTLFGAAIREAVSPSVVRPTVAGGAKLYELTVPLGQAWDSEDLDTDLTPSADPPVGDNYREQYCMGGESFGDYAAVGRLWDASSDGKYSGAPFGAAGAGIATPDMAALASTAGVPVAGAWPRMPYAARPTLTRMGTDIISSAEALVEYSLDAGANWHRLDGGYRILEGRLAVYLTPENLWSIHSEDDDRLVEMLFDTPANVRMRLTCTVAAPTRLLEQPARTAGAGSRFDQSAWYDRGAEGEYRKRAASSVLSGDADENVDGQEDFVAGAEAIRDAAQQRRMEAVLSVLWPDDETGLTDVVAEIGGIGYDLSSGGAAWARVVAVTRQFGMDGYGCQIALGTPERLGLR